jgi:hypothetical protein
MALAARRRFCSAGGKTRWGAVLLAAAVLAVPALHPIPSAAAETDCASQSLNRQDIAKVEAVARPTLAPSIHLEVTYACWNPDHSRAEVSTPKVLTPEGVQQWWAVSCQRDESTWACDRPELKQFIAVDLAVEDQSHAVELSFGQGIPVARARSLAARALTIYADPEARIRDCSSIEGRGIEPVRSHRHDKRASPTGPFHVNVLRDGSMDSVWLDDVDVRISFDAGNNPAGERGPCWLDIVVAN